MSPEYRETLKTELTNQACLPPAADRRIAAFCQAVLHLFDEPALCKLLDRLYGAKSEITPSYALNLLLRSFQRRLIDDPDYPQLYGSVQVWEASLRRLLKDEATLAFIRYDMLQRQAQSNVVERYKAFKLVIALLQGQLGSGLKVLDVGCSRNHGLKKIMMNLPFQAIACGVKDVRRLPHTLMDEIFNTLLRHPLSLGPSVGSDVVPLDASEDAVWAKSCSFYPSELLDTHAVNEYDYLDSAQVQNVAFETADFTGDGLSKSRKFDVITVSTFLYQLTDEQRKDTREILRRHLNDGGVIIYQDFVHRKENGHEFEFEANWFDAVFPYRTLVEFGNDIVGNLYEVLRWDSGRCRRWVPGRDLGEVLCDQYLFGPALQIS